MPHAEVLTASMPWAPDCSAHMRAYASRSSCHSRHGRQHSSGLHTLWEHPPRFAGPEPEQSSRGAQASAPARLSSWPQVFQNQKPQLHPEQQQVQTQQGGTPVHGNFSQPLSGATNTSHPAAHQHPGSWQPGLPPAEAFIQQVSTVAQSRGAPGGVPTATEHSAIETLRNQAAQLLQATTRPLRFTMPLNNDRHELAVVFALSELLLV